MKIKNLKKIAIIFVMLAILSFIFINRSYCIPAYSTQATDGGGSSQTSQSEGDVGSFSDWQQQADDFLSKGKQSQTITTNDAITALLPVGKLLVGIATIVLVVVGLIMGVKYMISGANEKAQLKQKLIYYVISVVLAYGAIGIFSLVVGLMNSILA